MPSRLEVLPPPLLAYVLEFAIVDFTRELEMRGYTLPLEGLENVALVSKTLLTTTRDFVKSFEAETMGIVLQNSATLTHVAAIIRRAELKGSGIHDLRVQLGPIENIFSMNAPKPGKLELLSIDWATIFEFMPKLKRLDLAGTTLLSRHFEGILEAASKYCPNVEILIMPWKADITHSVSGSEPEKLIALCSAMELWYTQGHCGGLKLFVLPASKRTEHLPFRDSKQLFAALARFCPGIKILARHEPINLLRDGYYEEKWAISLDTWKTFNASCTALTRFYWYGVPFADPFFRAFGDYVKPQLKTLAIRSNPTWNYKQCLRELDGSSLDEVTSCPGYGEVATDVAAVMKACLALTRLFIEIHHLGDCRSDDFYENVEAYGDGFWEAVAGNCPYLKVVSVSCCDHDDYHIIFVEKLTDRTLMHVAGLPYLLPCTLLPGRVTGKGIFEYIRKVSKAEDLIGNERKSQSESVAFTAQK